MAGKRKRPRKAQASDKGSPPGVGGEGGSGHRTHRSVVTQTEPGPASLGGPARASFDAEQAPPPSGRQRCAEAGIVPRAVVMDDCGAVGVVLEVSEDGEIEVAFTRGRLRTCTLAEPLEVLAGPRDWHPGRWVVINDWLRLPADWPTGVDDETRAFTLEAWTKLGELATARGFTIGEDLIVRLDVRRPEVYVPPILKLTRGEMIGVGTGRLGTEPDDD